MREAIQGDKQRIEVDTHLLKDYLASTQCVLVRYHDHRRFVAQDIASLWEKKPQADSLSAPNYRFNLVYGDISELAETSTRTFSRLLGKDVVEPYKQPDESHWGWLRRENRPSVAFIIGRDDNGTLIESPCDEECCPTIL